MTAPDREEYSLAPNLQQIVDASKTAPQWDTVNDRLALHRSFPEAGDGRPLPPMGDELMTAGLNAEDARFVAVQLAQNGWTLTPNPVAASQTPDHVVNDPYAGLSGIWASSIHANHAQPDPAAIREAAINAVAEQISEGIGAILRKFCDSTAAMRARDHLHAMPDDEWDTLTTMLAEASVDATLALIQKEPTDGR